MDADLFRRAWGNFATGVSLVTTVEGDGKVHGMTANGIASISLDPMLAMVCVGHSANTYPIIERTRKFGINILSDLQKDIGDYYARPDDRRDGSISPNFTLTVSGVPFLEDSLSSMACHVVNAHVEGDHTVFIGAVKEIHLGEGNPLIFFKSDWFTLSG